MPEFSHWEGWYSATSYSNAETKNGDALRWIGAGLNLAFLHGGNLGSGALNSLSNYNTVNDTTAALTNSSGTCELGFQASDGLDFWVNRGTAGTSTEKYDIASGSWTSQAAMNPAKRSAAHSDCWDGVALATHGGTYDAGLATDSCGIYTYSSNTWSTGTADTSNAKNQCTGFGDHDNHHWMIKDVARILDRSGASWAAGTAPTTSFTEAGSCSIYSSGRGYVIGDSTNGDIMESVGEKTQEWAINTAATGELRTPTTAVMDDFIIVKGYTGAAYVQYRFNCLNDTWTSIATLATGRQGQGASHDQHIQNRPDLVNHSVGALLIEGLTEATQYYVELHAHSKFFFYYPV